MGDRDEDNWLAALSGEGGVGDWVYWDAAGHASRQEAAGHLCGAQVGLRAGLGEPPLGELPIVKYEPTTTKCIGYPAFIWDMDEEGRLAYLNRRSQDKCEITTVINKEEFDKTNRQTNYNFNILDKRTKEAKESIRVNNASIENLILFGLEAMKTLETLDETVKRLTEKVNNLEATKIDHPSVSEDLINAERYLDDYLEVKKRYKRERFIRKQKIRSKLLNIKMANKKTPEHQPTPWRCFLTTIQKMWRA